jgi:hypothetical protein
MTTLNDAYEAGVDAVIADNTLSKNGFESAIRAFVTPLDIADADAWVTELIDEYDRIELTNNPTWANFRNKIISDGKPLAMEVFAAMEAAINLLTTTPQVREDINLMDLREERDNIDAAIDEMNVLIAAQPNDVVGRLVKDTLRIGKDLLRTRKEQVRNEIRAITGDPDSL